jgi:hypothetical protein
VSRFDLIVFDPTPSDEQIAAEWRRWLSTDQYRRECWLIAGIDPVAVDPDTATIHLFAAKALYGYKYGFDWPDVDDIRAAATDGPPHLAAYLCDLAERIAALLPPRALVTAPSEVNDG